MPDNQTIELQSILDEFERECARDYVVPESYERIRDEFARRIAATLGRPKAKSHPYGYERDTGAYDCTRCECGCINDISATYCNDCGGKIEIDESAGKEYYDGNFSNTVFAKRHDDGSLEFCERRYVPEDAATLGNEKKLITIALQLVRDHYDDDDARFDKSCQELEQWCFDHGKEELGEFAWACRCPACAFVPMDDERSTGHDR